MGAHSIEPASAKSNYIAVLCEMNTIQYLSQSSHMCICAFMCHVPATE